MHVLIMSPKTNTSSEYLPRHYESSEGKYGEESLIMDDSLCRMSSCESCSSSYGDLQTTLNVQFSDAHELSSHGENAFSTKTDNKQRDFNVKSSHDGSNEDGSRHQISSGKNLSSSSLESTEDENKQSNDLLDDAQSKISSLVLNNLENHMDGGILVWLPDFESDPCIWVPPEPENMEDDKPSIADNYEDDEYSSTEWKQASSLSSLDEHHGFIQASREKRQKAMLEAMSGQFKILVSRFLASEGVTFSVLDDDKSWVDIVASLSWKAALLIKPDATEGRAMDPGAYVKVKCIASGTPQQSELINGLVFKKNAAHKHMQTKFRNPKLLLLQGILGHSAVGLSSFNSMEQEKDYLKSITEMIEACCPNVVLVEKNISRDIQESLIEKGITVVSDMKHQRLTRISLCTGSPIISCSDFPSNLILPQCDFFHIERFVEECNNANESGKKPSKTLMYLEGFWKPLGCTILLKGAESDELKKIKRVVQYTVFAAYHLILETSFFADQRVFFTDNDAARRESVNFNNEPVHFIRSDATECLDNHEGCLSLIASEQSVDVPTIFSGSLDSFTDMMTSSDSHLGYTISENSGVVGTNVLDSFQSRNLLSLFPPRHKDNSTIPNSESCSVEFVIQNTISDGKRTDHNVTENSEIKEEKLGDRALDYKDNGIIGDSIGVNNDAYIAKKQQNEDIESVLDSQSILVLLSKQCTTKATICDQSHLSRIKYYGYFDISLGRFLKDMLLDQNSCTSCGEPPEAHVYCYTHQNGNLSVYVKKISPDFHLPGESEGKIWMWTRCLRCKNGSEKPTRRVPLSSSAHSLSFGKFLELSFSGHSAASRLSECGHSLHRDFLRFFGLGSKVAMFVYSSVKIYAACKPPPVLEFHDPKGQEWFKKGMEDVLSRGHKFFSEVSDLLQNLKSRYIGSQVRQCAKVSSSLKEFAEIEEMLIKEKTEFEAFWLKAIDKNGEVDISTYEVLDLKWLNQELLLELYIWDSRLDCLFRDMKCQRESVVVVDEVSRAPSHEDETTYCADDSQIDVRSTEICAETNDSSNKLIHIGLADLEQPAGMFSVKSSNNELVTSVLEIQQRPGYFPSAPRDNNNNEEVCASISSDIQNHSVPTVEDPFVDKATVELKNDEAVALSEMATKSSVNDNSSVYAKSEGPEELIWASFSDLKREYRNDLNDGSFRKFKFINTYTPSHLSPLDEPSSETDSLYFPVGPGGNVLSVSQDEISSIIACALSTSEDHPTLPENEPMELHKSYSLTSESSGISTYWSSVGSSETEGINMSRSISSLSSDESVTSISDGSIFVDHLLASDNLHPQVSVGMDKVSGRSIFSVACIYAKQFYTLRKKCCPSELAYISSLSRCKKWDAQGGKSKAFFAKTLDDRLIIKQIKKAELDSFLKFGPDYFKHVFHSLDLGSQSCLAKILGVYQVRQTKNGKEIKTDLMVMENLLFGHKVSRTYDLKGASFARYVVDAKYSKTILLDQNFVEDMCKSPVYLGGKTKHLLQRAIWNDTSFLTSINVMDYSLLVGVDDERGELVFGIIDYLRQYTWDKQLETWVKASMVVPRNELPTIISPKEYKKRFRKFMSRYFLAVPHSWNCEHCSPTCVFCVDGKKGSAKVHNTELSEQQ